LELTSTFGSVKSSIPHGASRFYFFSKKNSQKLEDIWTFPSTVGILVSSKSEITKNSTRITSVKENFISFFSAMCI
jgi:hypothetical protein